MQENVVQRIVPFAFMFTWEVFIDIVSFSFPPPLSLSLSLHTLVSTGPHHDYSVTFILTLADCPIHPQSLDAPSLDSTWY